MPSLGDDAVLWVWSGYDFWQVLWVWVGMFCGKCGNFSWLETMVRCYKLFENQPVTQSSQHLQVEEEGNIAASPNEQFFIKFTGFNQFNVISWIL